MSENLIIIGAGGFGREVAWLVERINNHNKIWNLLGFLDDSLEIRDKKINGYEVLGSTSDIKKYLDCHFVCAIGNPKIRKEVVQNVIKNNPEIQFATLIDPSVIIGTATTVGCGSIICANTIITVNVSIGEHVIINLGDTIGHDCCIGDFVSICPNVNLSGYTIVGTSVEIGTNTIVIPKKTICNDIVIGAGAVVTQNIIKSGTYVGIPARKV